MGVRMPNESPSQTQVPGERGLLSISRVALLVALTMVVAAVAVVYGWSMSLLATHTAGGVAGVLERLVLVLMGALGVAAIAALGWSVLQHPAVRRRYR